MVSLSTGGHATPANAMEGIIALRNHLAVATWRQYVQRLGDVIASRLKVEGDTIEAQKLVME